MKACGSTSEVCKINFVVDSFNRLFQQSENTCIKTGANEPFYQAATASHGAIIYSREDYLSSVLHEVSHWCIAGKARRKIDDYGYWYKPEGRNVSEQLEFEQVEIKPQAVEWALSLACDHPFHFSADNFSEDDFSKASLSAQISPSEDFKASVYCQLKVYLLSACLPSRAQVFFEFLNKTVRNNQSVEIPYV